MYIANTTQIREADRIQIYDRHLPGIILMETAGRLAAERLLHHYPDQQTFLVLAGPGNNGGDGLVIARYLHLAGKEVQVLLSHPPDRYEGDAAINYQIISELPIPLLWWKEEMPDEILSSFTLPPLLIDALLGTGIQSELRGTVAEILDFFRPKSLQTVAIDLPSGLSADTGEALNPALAATHTFTFQLPKVCHTVTPASVLCGEVEVLDIGIWPEVVEELKISRFWLKEDFAASHLFARPITAHKGSFGHVLSVGGSQDMPGAIGLSAYAALRVGAGLSTVLSPEACRLPLQALAPELMVLGVEGKSWSKRGIEAFDKALKGKAAVCMGPGMTQEEGAADFLREALPLVQVPLVLDADALNILAQSPDLWAMIPDGTILTPHPGEMRRLTGLAQVQDRRLEAAERLAQDRQVIVVLKGAGTLIALPDGRTYINSTGNPGMATAGSGDVLTGVIAGLLAQGFAPEIAAPLGVYLHGKAGDKAAATQGQRGLMARDIADWIGKI